MRFFEKPFVFAAVFAVVLLSFTTFVLLDTFVIPHGIQSASHGLIQKESLPAPKNVKTTDTSYQDENIRIEIQSQHRYDSNIYLAEVWLSSPDCLKTALAQDTFGTNVTQKTSEMAEEKNAILAINGDYYGANAKGYVIKNGVLYRESVRSDNQKDDLVIYEDGALGIVNESEISAQELVKQGVRHLFAFGPSLIEDGQITVEDKPMADNPRTAIGMIEDLHYLILVSDGRSEESKGLSYYEMAKIFEEYGCSTAYNLDGGGSSTMYFCGKIVNHPTTNGKELSERAVSDIVYIGY